ncbi:MAG: site-specific integrase [Bacteroides sp.]|nr:site-specific integrase [Bacteroides sp.]
MDKIIYSVVFNRKNKLNKKGTALVQVEAYLRGKKKYFSTKVYLRPDQWDSKRSLVKNHPNAAGLNRLIQDFLAQIERKELDLRLSNQFVTLDNLKESVAKGEESQSFIAFFRREVENSGLKKSSQRNHLSTLALLQKFKREITFGELSYEFITHFEQYLLAKGYHINTIAKHMKHIKRHINTAINMDLIDYQRYAFRKYRIKTIESKHTHLLPEELGRLEKLQLDNKHARYQRSLDAFLFCCYAGLRYSDFVNLSTNNISYFEEETWLIFKSVKTRNEVRLPLSLLFSGKAVAILRRYHNNLPGFFHLPGNSNVNKELKILAGLAGLKKHISFHTARHTNATILIYSGVSITTVQKLLGHRSVKTTQIYTDVMDMTIVHDLQQIRNKL